MNIHSGALAPTGSSCLDLVLGRLDKVKSAGTNKWKACCPAHDDKSPSLAISETSDGTVLLRCWTGCPTEKVVTAMGLEMRDLFPGEKQPRRGPSKKAVTHEQTVYLIGQLIQENGSRLNAEDQQRFELAKQRLGVE